MKPIRRKADYEKALAEVGRLWGAKSGTRDGDRLDVLATLIDAYESGHYPMDSSDLVEATGGTMSLAEALAQPSDTDFDFDPPRVSGIVKAADLG